MLIKHWSMKFIFKILKVLEIIFIKSKCNKSLYLVVIKIDRNRHRRYVKRMR